MKELQALFNALLDAHDAGNTQEVSHLLDKLWTDFPHSAARVFAALV